MIITLYYIYSIVWYNLLYVDIYSIILSYRILNLGMSRTYIHILAQSHELFRILTLSNLLRETSIKLIDVSMSRRKVRPLRASQSLSETFPCTGYKAFSLEGKALRENRVERIGI